MKNLFEIKNNNYIPYIYNWKDSEEFFQYNDKFIFGKYIKDILNLDNNSILPYFNVSKKKSYGTTPFKIDLCQYLNYFLTFFDTDKELIDIYIKIKFKCDYTENYPLEEFYNDIRNYILSPTLLQKVSYMNDYNCYDVKSKKAHMHEGLVYHNHHVNIIYNISLLMKFSIPLLIHYTYSHPDIVLNITEYLIYYYNFIFGLFDIDIKRKITATIEYVVSASVKIDYTIWNKQGIQGINPAVHTLFNLNEVILCVMPKLTYDKSGHGLIYNAIRKNLGYNVTDNQYEYEYVKVGGNLKNNANEFDKFEIYVTNTSEATLIYSMANSEYVIDFLSNKYNIENRLINHYYKELTENGNNMINPFQEKLIFSLFYKYYGECWSIKNSNSIDYIRLMLIAREMLRYEKLFLLAEVISSKIVSMSSRKDLNKKEKLMLESSEVYHNVLNKYNYDERIVTDIRSIIATVITSEFQIIDPDSDNYGKILTIIPEVIIYQILSYINLI